MTIKKLKGRRFRPLQCTVIERNYTGIGQIKLDYEGHKFSSPKGLNIEADLMQTVIKRKLGLFLTLCAEWRTAEK